METPTKQKEVFEALEGMTQNSPKAKELVFNPTSGAFEVLQANQQPSAEAVVVGNIAKDGFALQLAAIV